MVQYGLDVYGAAREGAAWTNDGGHNMGRKMPLLLAGVVLGDPDILEYGDASKHFIFQEDQQTFYVTQEDVDRARHTADERRRDPYTVDMIGTPEWGIMHHTAPAYDGSNYCTHYREINGFTIMAHVLIARLMGLQEIWNWPAVFDYHDRFVEVIVPDPQDMTLFARHPFYFKMWEEYRYSK